MLRAFWWASMLAATWSRSSRPPRVPVTSRSGPSSSEFPSTSADVGFAAAVP
jgi:hypothetical protein